MAQKILVVDDDIDSLKLIGLMLQKKGYGIVAANSGAQAIDKAAVETPNLIILDVMMPDLDGYEVTRQLRANAATKDIPVILFSAKARVDDKVAGFEAGADDYITKPTHPAELISRVQALLARYASPQAAAARDAAIFAFLAAKGGVGTSTLAVNVAVALAQRTETVLLDYRPGMSSTGLALGFSRSTGLANLATKHPSTLDEEAISSELVTHDSGLKLLLSSANPGEAELRIDPRVATAIIERLNRMANVLVMDLGVGLTTLNRQLVKQATEVVLVVEPQRTSLMMTRDLARALLALGVEPERVGVALVNRAQSEHQVTWQDAEQILDHELVAIISPAVDLASLSAEAGVPMILHQPNSVVANQFSRLAEELAERAQLFDEAV
jgi:pilus assembly protein CpaE